MSRAASPRHGRGVPGYRQVLANREFRALLGAYSLSVAGDQVARVAIALLVYRRSHSALAVALTYAVTYLPWLVGAPLLSGLADRFPRRRVMIISDVIRGGLVLLMCLPRLPLFTLFLAVFLVTLIESPFESARAALMPEVLDDEGYLVGSSLSNLMVQVGSVAGFAAGGGLVAALGSRGALFVDSLTFIASAGALWAYVADRPRSAPGGAGWLVGSSAGLRLVMGDPVLRSLVLLAWVTASAFVVPEGLAVVYAAHHGGGATTAGLLTAAFPLGAVVGGFLLLRYVQPADRVRSMRLMALVSLLPLAATAFDPPVVAAGSLWLVAGLFSPFQLAANKLFVAAVPNELRARAFAVAQAGLLVGQGAALAAAGALASALSPAAVICAAGVGSFVCVALLSWRWPAAGVADAAQSTATFSRFSPNPPREPLDPAKAVI